MTTFPACNVITIDLPASPGDSLDQLALLLLFLIPPQTETTVIIHPLGYTHQAQRGTSGLLPIIHQNRKPVFLTHNSPGEQSAPFDRCSERTNRQWFDAAKETAGFRL